MEQNSVPQNIDDYVSPIVVREKDEEARAKKEGKTITCIFWLIVLVIVAVVCAAIYLSVRSYLPTSLGGTGTDNVSVIPTKLAAKIDDYSGIFYNPSDHIKKYLPQGISQYNRPQLDFLNYILDTADNNQWDGNLTSKLKFDYTNLDKNLLGHYMDSYRSYQTSLQIPNDQFGTFVTDNTLIVTALIQARSDFMTFAQNYGVKQLYLDEIEGNVLPNVPGRINYLTGNYSNQNYIGSTVDPVNNDYSRRIINIDPHDVYAMYQDLQTTLFGQQLSSSDLIKASAKAIMYKEMGLVLMQAYINNHVPANVQSNGSADMWRYSDVNFLQYSTDYFWAWPYNKDISDARIAGGFMLKCLEGQYNLTDAQKTDLFNTVIGKDNPNMNTLNDIGSTLHTQYNSLIQNNWKQLPDFLYQSIFTDANYPGTEANKQLLKNMFNVTNDIPTLIGSFNPSEDKDLAFFKN